MRLAPKLLLLLLFASSPALAQPTTMNFTGEPPDAKLARFTGTAWTLYADGPIDSGAARRLENFIITRQVPGNSYIYLHSPGGSLIGGIALGHVIRKYELQTNVGTKEPSRAPGTAALGECYSACALAFLGGRFRFLQTGSRYGVHRFAFNNPAQERADLAQILSAAIVEYIRSMDVDPALFTLMASAAQDDILEPSREQLAKLNVTNNGRTSAKWSIESLDEVLYLKGEQDTVYGINKFLMICMPTRDIVLHVIFDAQKREDEIMQFGLESLMINGERVPLDDAKLGKQVANGWINARYRLNDRHLSLMQNARTVGLAVQLTPESGVFFGFDSMPFEDGASKLPGFVKTCRRR